MSKVSQFLDARVLPWPVKFLTNRFIILATIALLVPLIVFSAKTVFVLAVNSYLNTMSVAVSSIVLLYATLAEVRDRKVAAMQEQRAQEDHTHVVEMHQLVLDNMRDQHEEIQDLKQILAQMQGLAVERAEFQEGRTRDLRLLHPRGEARFAGNHVTRELKRGIDGAVAAPEKDWGQQKDV
jgi:hypothetical protein